MILMMYSVTTWQKQRNMVFWPFYPSNKLKCDVKHATFVPLTNQPSTLTSFMILLIYYPIFSSQGTFLDYYPLVLSKCFIIHHPCHGNVMTVMIYLHHPLLQWTLLCAIFFPRVNKIFYVLDNIMKCTMQVFV